MIDREDVKNIILITLFLLVLHRMITITPLWGLGFFMPMMVVVAWNQYHQ